MSKSKSKNNTSRRTTGISKVGLIVIALIVIVLTVGALLTFVWRVGPVATILGYDAASNNTSSDTVTKNTKTSTSVTIKPEQQKSLDTTQSNIQSLVATGDTQSLAKADEVAKAEVQAAKDSGNDGYIIMAELARANLLIDTGRAQEALDSILLPLLEKYKTDQDYSNEIYITIGLAYLSLDNTAKAEEYINQADGWGGQ
jgi:hypothetical protein